MRIGQAAAHRLSYVMLTEEWPSLVDTSFTSTPAARAFVAHAWRSAWRRSAGTLARATRRLNVRVTMWVHDRAVGPREHGVVVGAVLADTRSSAAWVARHERSTATVAGSRRIVRARSVLSRRGRGARRRR